MTALPISSAGVFTPLDLEGLRQRCAPLTGMLRLETRPVDTDGWVDADALVRPESGLLADFHQALAEAGFGCNRRGAAASLLLRFGWAAGFQIAAWLDSGVVLHPDRYALKFAGSTLLEAVWLQQAHIEYPATRAAGDAALLKSLVAFTAPLVASEHRWSRFSRYALWSMAVSSWAAQFAAIGSRLGRRDETMEQARRIFALDSEIAAAAPEIYLVTGGDLSRVCQKRAACCLYYRGSDGHFCASCPIIPTQERLQRNVEWVIANND